MNKISVVVPVYNVEKYIDRCVKSITNQTYKDLEIILVDDGSTDDCPNICDRFAAEDKRIKVIHKANGGVSSARNTGIAQATGTYIAFVDGDDYIEPQMYETLLEEIEKNNADVAVCAYNRVNDGGIISQDAIYPAKVIETQYGFVPFDGKEKFEVCCVWNKLYRLSVINNNKLFFDERFKVGEDFLFNYYYLKYCKKIVVTDYVLYNYYVDRDNSATGNVNSDFINRWRVYKIILENEKNNRAVYEHCLAVYLNQLLTCIKQLLSSGNKSLINENYSLLVDEIKLYSSEFKKLPDVSRFKSAAVSFIKVCPGGFRVLYSLYSGRKAE